MRLTAVNLIIDWHGFRYLNKTVASESDDVTDNTLATLRLNDMVMPPVATQLIACLDSNLSNSL